MFQPPETPLTQLQARECQFFKSQYRVTPRSVGQGSEAVAHLAEDVLRGKQIVCKLLTLNALPGGCQHQERIRRALQEADTLRQLSHPNILGFIDAMCSPHTVYTFMELASGGDLWSFIIRHEEVKEFDARIILRQVTRGLRFLHDKGIIHRDLKPENILLANSPRLAYMRVMLSDFGACLVPNRHRMTSQVGTALYQAPEIVRKVLQTPAVDIWSLGIIAMVILLGAVDYVNDMPQIEQGSLTKFVLETLKRSQRSISNKGQEFIVRCIQINPASRQTSEEADRDVWFCTPEKHLPFFHKLDRRMALEFKRNTKIRPMPMDIPDFLPEITGQMKLGAAPQLLKPKRAASGTVFTTPVTIPTQVAQMASKLAITGVRDDNPEDRARASVNETKAMEIEYHEDISFDIDFRSQIIQDLEAFQRSSKADQILQLTDSI
ncbi:hypothetical protein VHEMI07729 [[Torrubiella] hemipterigena]|nr:hypothetical protein VHEMI07729 [[Torrubiella] hemipterigena]